MRKHSGVAVVAYQPGHKFSDIVASLALLDMQAVARVSRPDQDAAVVGVYNLDEEAQSVADELRDEGFEVDVVASTEGSVPGIQRWRLV